MAELINNTGQATLAYNEALKQAQYTTNSLLRQYGMTLGGSVEGAQGALDPNSLFDAATGKVDEGRLASLFSQLKAGGTGIFSDISRAGASNEANSLVESRGRGIGSGGLANQRRELAEATTSGQMMSAKNDFVSGIGQGMSPIGGAWQGLQTAIAQDKYDAAQAAAAARAQEDATTRLEGAVAGIGTESAAATPWWQNLAPGTGSAQNGGQLVPVSDRQAFTIKATSAPGGWTGGTPAAGTAYKGSGGVLWVYRSAGPAGAGWYRQ